MLFKIGDIVKTDYYNDSVYGIVTKVYIYQFDVPATYYYNILNFFDGNIDYHLNERSILYAENPITPHRMIETCTI